MSSLKTGDAVGHFTVERVLGEGGMATVYAVRHDILGSVHALKILDPALVADAGIRDRFLAEGRIQAQLQHPNIVRVSDVISEPGVAGLIMDYVEGPTLGDWLDGLDRPATTEEVRSLMLPLLGAVGAVHEKGIIHRDLKPSNVLVAASRSGDLQPMIADFGIARIVEGSGIEHRPKSRTRTGAQMGTAAYMSPEQVHGEADLDLRTDIFALGAILYELVTGTGAFDSGSEFTTMRNVVDGRYEAPERLVADVQPGLTALIARALQGERSQRPQSCGEFADALAEVLDGRIAFGAAGTFQTPSPTETQTAGKNTGDQEVEASEQFLVTGGIAGTVLGVLGGCMVLLCFCGGGIGTLGLLDPESNTDHVTQSHDPVEAEAPPAGV